MKTNVTRIICCLLAAALLLTGLPASAHAAESRIEVVSNSAPLRKGPGKSYDTVAKLSQGDCLHTTGTVSNKHGNLWYEVQYGNVTAYLYADHVKMHDHDYLNASTTVAICKCGSYKLSESGQVQHMSYPAGDLLSNDFLKALAALEAAKAALASGSGVIAGALSAAAPYAAVAAVGGISLYIILSASGAQITSATKIESPADIDKLLKKTSTGKPYYKAAMVPGTGILLLDPKPMTLKEARIFVTDLRKKVVSIVAAAYGNLNGPLLNVWCANENIALPLCKQLVDYGNTCVRYGNSNMQRASECDKVVNQTNNGVTFEHYHIFHKFNTASFTKVCDVHILFGPPIPIEWNSYI